ncbi:hypothetical protein [Ralstonia mannitolilytica]|uniref:hypothetical protein n=1 Tax=Ralstonia mannitolilytica TaxID=105219 RepID=UPI00374A68D9
MAIVFTSGHLGSGMSLMAVVNAVQGNQAVAGPGEGQDAHSPLRGSAWGRFGVLACKRAWVDRLEAECFANGIPEYWRLLHGVVQVGRERVGWVSADGRRYSTYVQWQDVPFLSSFLLRRRAEQVAAEADGIPF